MLQGGRAEAGRVIPFAPALGRERRSDRLVRVPLDDHRGTLLLFTGVQYSRMVEPEPVEAAASSPEPSPLMSA